MNNLPDDLPAGNEGEEWVLIVANNNNGTSVDKTFPSLAALCDPLTTADTVRDLINIVRGRESDKETNVCDQ